MSEQKQKILSSAELRELRSLVTTRFKILKKQVPVQEEEIKNRVFARLDDEAREAIKAFEAEGSGFSKELAALNERILESVDRGIKAGVIPDGYYRDRHAIKAQYDFTSWHADVQAKYKTELKRVQQEAAAAILELDRLEAELLTELTLTQLASGAARDFLEKIPPIEQYLPPMPESLKELTR